MKPARRGPDDAADVEGRGVQADRVGQLVAPDHLDHERLAGRGVERRTTPEHEGQDVDLPRLGEPGHREQPEQTAPRSRGTPG